MIERFKARGVQLLRWSERYFKTDMVYAASGSFWLILSRVCVTIIGFGVSVAFGHFAAPDMYGNYRYVLILAGLFAALSLSGLSISVAQSTARGFEGALKQGFALGLRWSLGLVGLALAASAYYWFFQHNAFLAVSCIVIALFAPILNSASLFDPFLAGQKDFKHKMLFNVLDALIPAVLLVAAVFLTNRAIILIAVYYVANTAAALFFYWRAQRRARNGAEDPGLFRYSAHLSVMNVVGAVADKIDSLAVFAFLGPSEFALYAFAIIVPEQIKGLVTTLSPLAMPRFATRTIVELKENLWHRMLLLAVGLAAVLLAYVLLAPLLFKYLFPIYRDAAIYTQWYAFSILFAAVSLPLNTVLQAHKKTRALYIVSYTGSALLIVALPILTYLEGIAGAIAALYLYRACVAGMAAWQFIRLRE